MDTYNQYFPMAYFIFISKYFKQFLYLRECNYGIKGLVHDYLLPNAIVHFLGDMQIIQRHGR